MLRYFIKGLTSNIIPLIKICKSCKVCDFCTRNFSPNNWLEKCIISISVLITNDVSTKTYYYLIERFCLVEKLLMLFLEKKAHKYHHWQFVIIYQRLLYFN